MKRKFSFGTILVLLITLLLTSSCTENFSNGERIGMVTQFSKTGLLFKSWEGELHVTQTGMNSTMHDFQFSIDNDHEDTAVINQIDSAAEYGWKVKLTYHETSGKNWFNNRGETDHFITNVEILDKNPVGSLFNNKPLTSPGGGIHDTIYVVIDPNKRE